ncbi:hypothetical protein, partial [uncultured Porphyromonas sp.]|uniref:hypothetical protein n=1 Tax=uncultured Porphyromonas sp. TaxID=159274 RepID=UPI00260B1C7D
IYLPAILSLMPFPLIVPPLELESSSLGTKKFQGWNHYGTFTTAPVSPYEATNDSMAVCSVV